MFVKYTDPRKFRLRVVHNNWTEFRTTQYDNFLSLTIFIVDKYLKRGDMEGGGKNQHDEVYSNWRAAQVLIT